MSMEEENKNKKVHFGKRFKEWRQAQGISAYRLAKLTGVQPSFISNIEADRRPMPEGFMRKLAAISDLNVSYATLRAWKAEAEYEPQELREVFNNIAGILETSSMLCQENIPVGKLYKVPLKMVVDAETLSSPSEEMSESRRYIDFCSKKALSQDMFCLEVKGNSMWPPVPDGAFLLVQEVQQLKDGEKYIVGFENDKNILYKLVQYNEAEKSLIPLNPDDKPIPLDGIQLKRLFRALAYKVVWSC